jgi:hypothetical protein
MMSFATPRRTKAMLAQVCGVVTILALVVTPVCSPLCAAQVCSRTSSTGAVNGPCHFAEAAQQNAQYVRGIARCGATELPSATLTSSKLMELSSSGRFLAWAGTPYIFSAEFPALMTSQRGARGPDLQLSPHPSVLTTVVLRF